MSHFDQRILCRLDPDGADFEFGGLGDGVVTGAGEDVDVGFGEAETCEDGPFGTAGGGFDFEADFATAGGDFSEAAVGEAPDGDVIGMDF